MCIQEAFVTLTIKLWAILTNTPGWEQNLHIPTNGKVLGSCYSGGRPSLDSFEPNKTLQLHAASQHNILYIKKKNEISKEFNLKNNHNRVFKAIKYIYCISYYLLCCGRRGIYRTEWTVTVSPPLGEMCEITHRSIAT